MFEPNAAGARARPLLQPPQFLLTACLIAIALAACPAVAQAKAKRHKGAAGLAKRIAITSADGRGKREAAVRVQLAKALKKSKIKVIQPKEGTAPGDDQQWVALGRKLEVDGFVQLSFDASHGKRTVEITVRTAADGTALGSETFTARGPPAKLGAAVARRFWKKLGARIEETAAAKADGPSGLPPRDLAHEDTVASPAKPVESLEPAPFYPPSQAPPAPEPEATPVASAPDEEPAETDDQERSETKDIQAEAQPARSHDSDSGKGRPGEPTLMAVAQARFLHRSFTYTPSAAADTTNVAAPTVGAEVAWFPLHRFGLAVGGEAENWAKVGEYPTLSSDLHASLLFRMALSFGELYLQAGGFRHFFAVLDDTSHARLALPMPDVVYSGVRAGGALALPLTAALVLTVAANYRLVTGQNGGGYPLTSQIYFPRATQGPAFDAAVTLAFRLTRSLAIQGGGDIRRYVMALRGNPGDRINASGATDLYLAGWIGLGGVFEGR